MNRTAVPFVVFASILLTAAARAGSAEDPPAVASEFPRSEVTSKAPRGTVDARGRANDSGRADPADPQPKLVDYIVGGKKVKPGAYPFAVAIAYRNVGGELSQYCGGALLRPNIVLTAAHCRAAVGDVAVIGREDLSKTDGEAIRIVAVVAHDDYDPVTFRNDIALLRLARSAPPQYRPIEPAATADDLVGRTVTAIGWGRTTDGGRPSLQLLETSVPVIAERDCAAKYQQRYAIVPEMVCASGPGKDACQGDSGGPLFTTLGDDRALQVGITSFGIGCADPSFPGVYTRVASYARWIQSQLPE